MLDVCILILFNLVNGKADCTEEKENKDTNGVAKEEVVETIVADIKVFVERKSLQRRNYSSIGLVVLLSKYLNCRF